MAFIGFPTSNSAFSKFFNLPVFAISKTSEMSFELSIASWIFFAESFLSSWKNAEAKDSRIVLSFKPILKSPIKVLTRYFASIGEEEARSSTIKEIFFSTVPFPSNSGSFLKLAKTFSVVRFFEESKDCFFFFLSSSTTKPKSPNFFHSETTEEFSTPMDFAIAFIAS